PVTLRERLSRDRARAQSRLRCLPCLGGSVSAGQRVGWLRSHQRHRGGTELREGGAWTRLRRRAAREGAPARRWNGGPTRRRQRAARSRRGGTCRVPRLEEGPDLGDGGGDAVGPGCGGLEGGGGAQDHGFLVSPSNDLEPHG